MVDVRLAPHSDRESGLLHKVMSAIPSKADMCGATRDVRFGPKADSCSATILLDHCQSVPQRIGSASFFALTYLWP